MTVYAQTSHPENTSFVAIHPNAVRPCDLQKLKQGGSRRHPRTHISSGMVPMGERVI